MFFVYNKSWQKTLTKKSYMNQCCVNTDLQVTREGLDNYSQ